MSLETYRLEVRKTDTGIDADVYGADDLIEESGHLSYDEYDLELSGDRDEFEARTAEVTADVTTLDLQVQLDDGGVAFRLLGDRDELATIRVDADE